MKLYGGELVLLLEECTRARAPVVASQMTDEEGKRRVIQRSAIQRPFVSRKKDEKFEKGLNIY